MIRTFPTPTASPCGGDTDSCSCFPRQVVPPAGVEPAACPLGRGRSIRLSYGGLHARVYPAPRRASITARRWTGWFEREDA